MRLFVAVNLPDAERAVMWRAAAPLRDTAAPVKWLAAEALHITIKFLGEVAEPTADLVGRALSEAVREVRPFDVGIGGFGAFPGWSRPRVVWCGVENHPALELLANDVARALQPFDFESELQPFRPHVTLGRAKKDAKPAALVPLGGVAADIEYASVIPVGGVDLMRSTRGPKGSRYEVHHAAVFGPAGAEA